MNRVDAHFERFLFDESNGSAAKAAAAVIGGNIQFVDKSIVAMELEAEADGQDGIADEGRVIVEEPGTAKSRKGQKLTEGGASGGLVKFDGAGLVFGEGAHHGKK